MTTPKKPNKRSIVFEYWQSGNKQWYFHIRSGNGEIIAQSEGYLRSSSCLRIYALLLTTVIDGPKKLPLAPACCPIKPPVLLARPGRHPNG